jgi:hypothetical protein
LASLTKKERLDLWRSRIRYGQERRRVFFEGEGEGHPPGADFAIEVYRGKSKPKWWCDEDPWVHVGKTKSAVRAAIPSLMYANPRFRVFPKRIDIDPMTGADVSYQRAKAKELWLNHIWKECNAQQHVRAGLNNAFFAPSSIKCGYLCDFEDDEKRGVFAKNDAGNYVLDEFGDPTLERGEFLKDEDGEIMRDESGWPLTHPGRITKEKWFVSVMDPKLCIFDTESGCDFFQHRYFIEERVIPLADAKADPRFTKAARERLVATETLHSDGKPYQSGFHKEETTKDTDAARNDEERIRLYDIFDFQNDRYLVLPECGSGDENEEFLLDAKMPRGMEQGPTRHLKFTEDFGSEWYGIPDAIDMALLNQEYNITRSQEMIHREHSKSRYGETPGAFDGHPGSNAEEERAKLAHGPDGSIIKVAGADSVFPLPKAYLDPSFLNATTKIAMDFNEVGGMPGEMRGVADSETATQASILASGAEIRNNDRRDNQVQTWLCEIARALLISGQANAELDTIVMEKIAEETGGVLPFRMVKLAPEELLGEFEVEVELGSTLQKSDPRTAAQLRELMGVVSQNPWIAQVKGLTRRALDAINLDPVIAEELAMFAEQAAQAQNPPAGPEAQQQVLGDTVMGGLPSMTAGAGTGAPVN